MLNTVGVGVASFVGVGTTAERTTRTAEKQGDRTPTATEKGLVSESLILLEAPAPQPQVSLRQVRILAVEFLVALPLGILLLSLGLGGLAWILSGIAAGTTVLAGYRRWSAATLQPNRSARKVGQALVGFTIGCSIAQSQIVQMSAELPVFLLLTLFILASGTAIGYLYSRLSHTNLLTALLATVPGGIGVMASIAADYGRNVTQVALVQVIRVTSVILLIPLIARSWAGELIAPERLGTREWLNTEPTYLALLALGLLLTMGCISLSRTLRIPAAPFFGSLVAGIAFNPLLHTLPWSTSTVFVPPPLLSLLGHILLGITIGEYWGSGSRIRKQAIVQAIFPVVLTIGSGFLAAAMALHLTQWDWLTCLLVTAPGGAPEMILVALALHHNVETVTAGHMVRLMAINASLPLWVWLFRSLDHRFAAAGYDDRT